MRLGLVWAKQRKKYLGQLGPENRRMEAIPLPLPPPSNEEGAVTTG